MAWDDSVNHRATLIGATIEFGYATLSGNTVEVPTRLSKILSASAVYAEAPGAAQSLCCDGTITAGYVTFADATVAAKKFYYILVGLD
jgi:hypothetical protein